MASRHRLVYDPDPRAGATLMRAETGHWTWARPAERRWPQQHDRLVAVIAPDGRSRLSGLYDTVARRYFSRGTVAHGQRRGTATKMWAHLIATLAPRHVSMDVVTNAGWAMAASLRRRYPNLRWSVSDMR